MRKPLLTLLLAACCVAVALPSTLSYASSKKKSDPIAELRAAVDKDVTDKDRAAKMSAVIDEIERVIREAEDLLARQGKALTPLLTDYGSTREAIEAKLAELNVERVALARRMLEAHLAFKSATTAEEWKKLRKAEEKALEEALAESIEQQEPVAKGAVKK